MPEAAVRRAVVLASGGLDSTTCLAVAAAAGFEVYSLTFDYGQRHRVELEAAERCAKAFHAKQHLVIKFDLRAMGGSALTSEVDVPKGRDESKMVSEIPITYVPARNTIFLSFALGWAEVLGSSDIFIGVNAVDYSGYPDCRPEFIAQYQKLAEVATKAGVEGSAPKIHTPLLSLRKSEIISLGLNNGVDYSMTHSCYDPDINGLACGQCDSCILRRQGFADAGVPDPTRYSPPT
jgi:7-cyano-7-deazaguanine synthase